MKGREPVAEGVIVLLGVREEVRVSVRVGLPGGSGVFVRVRVGGGVRVIVGDKDGVGEAVRLGVDVEGRVPVTV